jgi:hypothetical protein
MTKDELAEWLLSAEGALEVSRCVEGLSCLVWEEQGVTMTNREHVAWALTRIAEQARSCPHWTAFLLIDWMAQADTLEEITLTSSYVPTQCYEEFMAIVLALVHDQYHEFLVGQF